MLSKQQIRAHLDERLIAMFEVAPADIHTQARLYEDLDIDSLDAVDLIIELRDFTGAKVQPEQFKNARTVGDVVDAIHALTERSASLAQASG